MDESTSERASCPSSDMKGPVSAARPFQAGVVGRTRQRRDWSFGGCISWTMPF